MKLRYLALLAIFAATPSFAQTVRMSQDQSSPEADFSGTIAVGGTAQQAIAANLNRKYLLIANPHATAVLFYNTTGAATVAGAGSIPIPPNGYVRYEKDVPTGAVSVNGGTSTQPYTVKEF